MRFLPALLFCIALNVQAETFNARVVAVMDGDTVLAISNGKKIKIRLVNIDAPEKDQPFGRQARDSLFELVGKKEVQIERKAIDIYERTIGQIYVNGIDVNKEQVKRGMAWEYTHYHSDKIYIALQSEAQQARRGLWKQTSPQAPWQWRKLHPSIKPVPQVLKPNSGKQTGLALVYDMECGKKRYCSQMATCDEAHFYLTRCGVKTLDRNKDGMPCENLCGSIK